MAKAKIKDEPTRECASPDCKKKARKGRKECPSCSHFRLKSKDPIKFAYLNLKRNAKRRGKTFDITIDDFRDWCAKTEYIKGRGRSSESYHIDRIDETKGYSLDNIQILTNAENTRKYCDYKWNGKTMEFTTRKVDVSPPDDCPF